MWPYLSGFDMPTGCECCRPKMTAMTLTVSWHKWTKKEIEAEIIELGKEMISVKWYDRADVRRRLKHWTEKLKRYEEAEKEFNLIPNDPK